MSKLDKINSLIEWATSNNAYISPKIQFQEISPNNIGAICTEQLDNSDHDMIEIPTDLLITTNTALESFPIESVNANSVLKLYLARERTSSYITKSKYRQYLELLPSLIDIGSPLTWSPEDKSYLKGTNLGNSLSDILAHLVEEWWQIVNLIPEDFAKPQDHFINLKFYYEYKYYKDEDLYSFFKDVDVDNWTSFANYVWANQILKSRSFPAYLIDKSKFKPDSAMLIPVLDLLNHDSKAEVYWGFKNDKFCFRNANCVAKQQVFNNYGMKGNEELLLAYGFAIEQNDVDSVALIIKIPQELVTQLLETGVKLPTIKDYTTSVVAHNEDDETTTGDDFKDGVLFFITKDHIPEALIQTFQFLVQNELDRQQQASSESKISLRMKLAGLNQLRNALETKRNILPQVNKLANNYIKWYIESQQRIYTTTINKIKQMEKEILQQEKANLVTLKNVYKKDVKFQQSLLIGLGFPSYESILEHGFQDQCWILWLMRCSNRDEYEESDDQYIPAWVKSLFDKLKQQIPIDSQEILNYQPIYQQLFPDLSQIVPEIYNKGEWTVENMIIASRIIDLAGFIRGKDQECILVKQN
ncbi:Protein-lysine N-methyltransferase EFM1 [Spathaspora sp. JA1]|nr:Protein-lysine N-methyltransferase EFM1 [Spathaspora sp. JA1]